MSVSTNITPTTSTWMSQEKNSFSNFNEFIATRLEDGIFRSIAEKMKNDLKATGESSLQLPWGTYTAEAKAAGEGGNITPAFEPSKAFMKALNDDSGNARDRRQDSFDSEYTKLFKDYVAYGYFYPEDVKNAPAKDKGLKMSDTEVDYFLNGFAQVMTTIARDRQRDGKIYRLEINAGFPHGAFDFEYRDDEIKVKFVPSKVFKQYLKDDDIANAARDADFADEAENG